MAVITAIEKERSRMRITIDEGETVLVTHALFRERPLQVGDPIDPEEYDRWLLLRQYRQALDRAVGMLALRARSRREIEERLLRAGYRPATVEMVLYKLESESLLDDADFARQWVEARSGKQLGRGRITQELRRKGVCAEVAEAALAEVDEDAELQGAVKLVEKALRSARPGEDPRKTAQRITAMLARRGYGWQTAREALQQAMDGLED